MKERNIRAYIFNLLIIFMIFLGCSSEPRWEGTKEVRDGVVYMHNTGEGLWRNRKKLVMEEIFTIGVEEGDEYYILNNPRDIATDKEDNIYICDTYDYCIKVYNQAGKFLRRIGKQGHGPGEFSLPKQIVITNNDKLCVLDYRRVSYFTSKGAYINSFNPEEQFEDITTIPGRNHILVTRYVSPSLTLKEPLEEKFYAIAEYNDEGETIRKFGELVKMGSIPTPDKLVEDGLAAVTDLYQSIYISGLREGKLLVVHHYPYRLDIYNEDFQKIISITRDTGIFTEPQMFRGKGCSFDFLGIRSELFSYSGFELPDKNFIVTIIDRGPNFLEKLKENDWSVFRIIYDLYDPEGHFLQSFNWKEYGEEYLIHIDKKGFAYTRSGPDEIPRVLKYKISFVDK